MHFQLFLKLINKKILDAGWGTGVPTFAIFDLCDGMIYAVDTDQSSLNGFKEKFSSLHIL